MAVETEKFNVKKFVENLQKVASTVRCDDTQEFFRKMELPAFYNEDKFKRGQKFFHDHIFAMFYAKLLGLISDLAFPDGQAILRFTKQSSEPETAFRRYVSTIFHMCTWYNSDLKPGSKLWESLVKVRNYHNIASKTCKSKGVGQITQYQMILAQFGFMGYALSRPKVIGLHKIVDQDLEGFVHLWRVIGHLLGIEERFNICRDSLSETKAICDEITTQVVRPLVLKWDPSFLNMTGALTSGLWCMVPIINRNVCLQYIYQMVRNEDIDKLDYLEVVKLNYFEIFLYYIVKVCMYTLQFDTIRVIQKYNMYFILYCTEKCPFLAYYRFKKTNFCVYQRYSEQKINNYLS
ncbi:hypothetical protein Trydic_g1921 [Trypoxylus dichotomus]